MEVTSSHSEVSKKKKKKGTTSNIQTIIQPKTFNGKNNWLNLQSVRGALNETSTLFFKVFLTFLQFPSTVLQCFAQAKSVFCNFLTNILKKEDIVKKKSADTVTQHKTQYKRKRKRNRNNYKKSAEGDINQNKVQNRKEVQEENSKELFKFNFSNREAAMESDPNDSSAEGFIKLTKTLAMDCEMVGVGEDGVDSILARVSIVNSFGECVYDTFVKPTEKVTDYRTEFSGVRPGDLKDGKDLYDVQKDVLAIIQGRRLVGHDLRNDFQVLLISHPKSLIRDTSKYKPFTSVSGGQTPGLRKLVAVLLGAEIQSGEHNSIEDAQAAMMLYLRHKKEWEKSLKPQKYRKKN